MYGLSEQNFDATNYSSVISSSAFSKCTNFFNNCLIELSLIITIHCSSCIHALKMEQIWREWGDTRGEERVLEEAQQETRSSILCPIVPCRFPLARRWQSHMDRAKQMSGSTQLLVKVNGCLRHSNLIREAETSFHGRPTRLCAFYAQR